MKEIFHPDLLRIIDLFWYRFRFLAIYIVIGFLSIILEIIIRYKLISLGFEPVVATILGLISGVFFAFFGNLFFNFQIPPSRRRRAFFYFIMISFVSGLLQWLIGKNLNQLEMNYEQARFMVSGTLFMVAYILHRKFSFRDFKQVGVAIYANGVEDLIGIHNKIGQYPDFIHVDIVDNSFNPNAKEIKTYRMETIKALWPTKKIHVHIMSKMPSKYLLEIIPYSDIIYIHLNIDEAIDPIFERIRKHNKTPGIVLTSHDNIESYLNLIRMTDAVLVLSIPKPGFSGQKFDMDSLDKIEELNKLSFRKDFLLCIDGGVNDKIVPLLKAENIVSGSAVLNHQTPQKQILRLQTAGRYEVS